MKIPVADCFETHKDLLRGIQKEKKAVRMSDILGAAWEMPYVTRFKVSLRFPETY